MTFEEKTLLLSARLLPARLTTAKLALLLGISRGNGLRTVLKAFLDFLQEQWTPKECEEYIEVVSKVQTGDMTGREGNQQFQR